MAKSPLTQMPGNVVAALATERARISAILESDAGKARPSLAVKLALHSTLDADTALNILTSSQPEKPYFESAMEREGGTGVNAGGAFAAAGSRGDPKAARLAEINGALAHYNQVKGYTVNVNHGG